MYSKHMATRPQLDSLGALRRRKLIKGGKGEAGNEAEKDVELNKREGSSEA